MALVSANISSGNPAAVARPLRFWPFFLPAFALAAVIFSLFPEIDLRVSALFFDAPRRTWPHAGDTPAQWWRVALNVVSWGVLAGTIVVSLAATVVPLARRRSRAAWFAGIRAVAFVGLCYAIGPGLIVNLGFKNHWGRARPNTVIEFGGNRVFSPALKPTNQCGTNCSFVSGEGALGFTAAAPSLVLDGGARWAMLGGGAAVGIALGGVRIIQGAHFVSDVVFSGLAAWFSTWLSYGLVYRNWLQGLRKRRRRNTAADAPRTG